MDWHKHAQAYVCEKVKRGSWAKDTAATKRVVLFQLCDHLDGRKMTKRRIERWALEGDLSPGYRRQRLSAARGWCAWLMDRKIIDSDPTHGIERPKEPKGLPRFLQAGEVAQVLAACPNLRAQVMVSLMVQEGLRRAEVAAVRVEDIDPDRGTLTVRGKGGRGHETRVLPLTPSTTCLVRRYLAETGGRVGSHLLRSSRGGGMSPGAVGAIVSGIMRDCGVKMAAGDGRSAHALRHTCAQHVLDGGADIMQVQAILGHSSVQTTQLYLRGQVAGLAGALSGRDYSATIDITELRGEMVAV